MIAKQTALICNSCRSASEKCENASTKRNFVQLAKDIANGTATVVQAVKVLMCHDIHLDDSEHVIPFNWKFYRICVWCI